MGQNELVSGGSMSQSPTSGSSYGSNAVTSNERKFYIGDKVELSNIIVSLDAVTENSGSTYNKPKDANVFVLCSFSIENNSASEINISSVLCFDAYCDGYTCNYSLSAQMESNDNQLDGTVAAGKKMKGTIGFEVPSDWKELEIHFTPDFWAQQDIIFIANH